MSTKHFWMMDRSMDFFWVLQFPPLFKLTTMILLKYCWKWR
jgi:hypothetical protein